MRLVPTLIAALAGTACLAAAPMPTPTPSGTPHTTKVVARSRRLVAARTSDGGTQSFNCQKPANAKRAICRKR